VYMVHGEIKVHWYFIIIESAYICKYQIHSKKTLHISLI
jgi:hypothetical protein